MKKFLLILLAIIFNTISFGMDVKMNDFVQRAYELGYEESYESREESYHTVSFDKRDGQFRKIVSLTKVMDKSVKIEMVSRYVHQKDRTSWVEKDIYSSLNKFDGVISEKILNKIVEKLKTVDFNNPPKSPRDFPQFNIEKNTSIFVTFGKNYISLFIEAE